MPAPSLVKLATDMCIANVRSITSVGDFEYWKIRKVLVKIESPEQLRQIEENSPQIQGEDAELWQTFIARDVPNWQQKNYVPKDPKKWYMVYRRYMKEENERLRKDEELLRARMNGEKANKESHLTKVVDARFLPKLPRDPRMLSHNGGVPTGRKKGPGKAPPSALTFTAGSRTKITDGKSMMTRVRKEAKEAGYRGKLSGQAHTSTSRASMPLRAPAGMVKEHQRAAIAPVRIAAPRATRPDAGLQERENRLRAMKMGSKPQVSTPNATVLDFGDEDDGTDDLFNEKETVESPPKMISKIRPGDIPPPPRSSELVSLNGKGKAPVPILQDAPRHDSTQKPEPPRMVQKRKVVDIFHRAKKIRR